MLKCGPHGASNQRLRLVFDKFDINKDHRVSKDEFRKVRVDGVARSGTEGGREGGREGLPCKNRQKPKTTTNK